MKKTKPTGRILDMTQGKPLKLLLTFALPLFLGNILQQFYNLADTSIAGHLLGDAALAQIGATSALYSLLTNFAFGLNNGLALTVSRSFGAGDQKEMKRSVCWMVTLAAVSALVMTVCFLLLRRPLLRVMQTPDDVLEGALSYLTVILAGIPLTMAYNLESALLQSMGNSVTPLCFLLFSSFLNVGLDFFFIGNPLNLGVQGAAAATVLSQGISAALGGFYILKNYPEIRFGKEEWKVPRKFVSEMFWTGLSMALMSAIYNLGSVILQSSINALGSVYIAAQVGGRKLAELFYVPGIALGTSAATFSSQNYGAGKHSRIAKGAKSGIFMYFCWWLVALAFVIFLAPAAVRFITGSSNPEVIANGALYLRIGIPMIPPMAVLVILRNILQGMRRPGMPLFCSCLELIGKTVFAVWLVPAFGYPAVCVCEPVTWVICCAVIAVALFRIRGEFVDKIGEQKN